MTIKCVVACTNANGGPDLYFVKVKCKQSEYDEGEHYEMAKESAKLEGYEGPFVVFDEIDGPTALFDLFEWSSASVFEA